MKNSREKDYSTLDSTSWKIALDIIVTRVLTRSIVLYTHDFIGKYYEGDKIFNSI